MKSFLALVSLVALPSLLWSAEIIEGEMAGYLFAPAEKVLKEFNGGFSLYAAAWPLVGTYPGHRFQTGLCGTWMHPQWSEAEKPEEKCDTDIEGGILGCRYVPIAAADPAFIHLKAFDPPPQEEQLVITTPGIVQLGELLARSYLEHP